jgi:hypothetical protein
MNYQHYSHFIFSREFLNDVLRVDITICGDHGKGQFRMTLKMIVRYSSDKQPFLEIFQVANIDFAKDDITVLKETVLKPIGKA